MEHMSRLRSRRIIYSVTQRGYAITEKEFEAQFERAIAHGMRRAGIEGKAAWLGKGTVRGEHSGGGWRKKTASTFKGFEVYLQLPEAVIPGRMRNWLNIGAPGWVARESIRGREQSWAAFLAKPLKEWKEATGRRGLLGPGISMLGESALPALPGVEDVSVMSDFVPETEVEDSGEEQYTASNSQAKMWTRSQIEEIVREEVSKAVLNLERTATLETAK
ncbi:hypothetical protein PtrSN002B_012177, partial [Pyrenophora tritici-repentis]